MPIVVVILHNISLPAKLTHLSYYFFLRHIHTTWEGLGFGLLVDLVSSKAMLEPEWTPSRAGSYPSLGEGDWEVSFFLDMLPTYPELICAHTGLVHLSFIMMLWRWIDVGCLLCMLGTQLIKLCQRRFRFTARTYHAWWTVMHVFELRA